MTTNPYGPDKPCRRTACTETTGGDTGDHLGGAHLNPVDRDHYDGISTAHGAAPHTVRDAVRPLLNHVNALTRRTPITDTALRTKVEVAVDACYREISRLGQQVAHVSVDRDRQVRDATARAADCTTHGDTIRDLERQLNHWADSQDRTERARLALLGEHQAITDLIAAYDTGRVTTTTDDLITALKKVNTATAAAHTRAHQKRKPK